MCRSNNPSLHLVVLCVCVFEHCVKTRRETRQARTRLSKFVLRCVQLMVGLPCPIGLKAIQRVPKTSPARATARSGFWTSPVSSPYFTKIWDDSRLFALHFVRRITSASSDASSTGNVCTTPSVGASVRTTLPPGLCCDRYALKAAPRASSPSRTRPPALPFEHSLLLPNLLAPCTAPRDAPSPVHLLRQSLRHL